jgi:hypothetical protein
MYAKYIPVLTALLLTAAAPQALGAQEAEYASSESEAQITSAMSAAPSSVSADATIVDWNMNVLREGTNEWTCLPDYTEIGFSYMLQGDSPVSNSDPYATEPTGPEDWVTDVGPHLMIVVPDKKLLKNISTDHLNGGPWVMWPNTPYAHIMIPLESRGRAPQQLGSVSNSRRSLSLAPVGVLVVPICELSVEHSLCASE